MVTEQEQYSTYQYGWNNPVLRSDPNGDCPCILPALPFLAGAATPALEFAAGTAVVVTVAAGFKKLAELGAGSGVDTYSSSAVSMAMSTTKPGELTGTYSRMLNSSSNNNQSSSNPSTPNGGSSSTSGAASNSSSGQGQSSNAGKRRQNRIPDTGAPNSTATNQSGTTTKKYGPDGNVQKEFNKGHQGNKVPKNEQNDHVHDHKPKPNRHPNDPQATDRQPGIPPKKGELKKDFGL